MTVMGIRSPRCEYGVCGGNDSMGSDGGRRTYIDARHVRYSRRYSDRGHVSDVSHGKGGGMCSVCHGDGGSMSDGDGARDDV